MNKREKLKELFGAATQKECDEFDIHADNSITYGDPVYYLVELFNNLFKDQIQVKVLYVNDLEDWLDVGLEPVTMYEIQHLFPHQPNYDEMDLNEVYRSVDERDFETGDLYVIKKTKNTDINEYIIGFDWQCNKYITVSILLEILPRLTSLPIKDLEIKKQFIFRKTRQQLQSMFETLLQAYINSELEVLLDDPEFILLVHTTLEENEIHYDV